MGRFMVVQHNNNCRVIDTEYVQLKQPSDLAVAIYFKHKLRAEQICNMMNAEWQEFLADPDGEKSVPMAEKVDRVMKVLKDGPSCYAQRREVIMAVIKQHEKEFEEERAAEAALWEMPLDDE